MRPSRTTVTVSSGCGRLPKVSWRRPPGNRDDLYARGAPVMTITLITGANKVSGYETARRLHHRQGQPHRHLPGKSGPAAMVTVPLR